MKQTIPDRLTVTDAAQRKSLSSPLRLELLGHFDELIPLSANDLAARMGRAVTALYYHISQLVEQGLLRDAGTHARSKRDERLLLSCAAQFEIAASGDSADECADAVQTLRVAQRMAIADMRAALTGDVARTEGPERNCFALRVHAKLDPQSFKTLNDHLDAIVTLLSDVDQEGDSSGEFCSLTLALMPLKGRRKEPQQ